MRRERSSIRDELEWFADMALRVGSLMLLLLFAIACLVVGITAIGIVMIWFLRRYTGS